MLVLQLLLFKQSYSIPHVSANLAECTKHL